MNELNSPDAVIVNQHSAESSDDYDIILSNINFINAQLSEYLRFDEIAPDAKRSYFVDYFLAQVNNGGFSQFVYNSNWQPETNLLIHEGLVAMGANETVTLFDAAAKLLNQLSPEQVQEFFESDYFGENEERDFLNGLDDQFFAAWQHEDLIALNAKWLRGLPNLLVVTDGELQAEAERRGAALPDRKERIAAALANEPRYMKIIRALCEHQGLVLNTVTAGDPTFIHEGSPAIAWHFLTEQGHHFMVDAGHTAVLFDGSTRQCIAEIAVPTDNTE